MNFFGSTASKRGIYSIYLVAFIDLFGVSLFLPLISREIRDLGASPLLIGIVSSVYGAIQLFSSPIIGGISDRYGRRIVLMVTILSTSAAYVLQGSATNLIILLIARSIAGVFKHTQTLAKACLAEISPNEKSYTIGNFNAFGSMGFIVGPAIGGHLMSYEGGFRNTCFLSALAFLVNSVIIIMFVPETVSRDSKSNGDYKRLGQGKQREEDCCNSFRKLGGMSTRTLISILLLRFVFSFATLVSRANLPLILEAKYSASLISQGYLSSLQALISTIAGFALGPLVAKIYKEKSRKIVLHGATIQMISLMCLYVSPSYELAGLSLLILSASNPFLRLGITTLSLDVGDSNDPGAILGLGQTSSSSSRMIAPMAAGFAFTFSNDGPVALGAIAASVGFITTLTYVREHVKLIGSPYVLKNKIK